MAVHCLHRAMMEEQAKSLLTKKTCQSSFGKVFRDRACLEGSETGNCSQKNARQVGKNDGLVFWCLQKAVNNPERAVNAGNQRLQKVAFMPMYIVDNLGDIRYVHQNGKGSSNPADNFQRLLFRDCACLAYISTRGTSSVGRGRTVFRG